MYQAGVPLRHMRICNLLARSNGKDYGSITLSNRMLGCYVRTSQRGKKWRHLRRNDNHFYGHRKILKPEHLDWQNMHYCCSIACRKKQLSITAINRHLFALVSEKKHHGSTNSEGDIGAKDIPSWRRICKVLLITITGVGHYHLALRKRRTIRL